MSGVVRDTTPQQTCMPLPQYHYAMRFILIADTFVTLIIPSIVIIVLNVGITFKICNFIYQRRLRQASLFTTAELDCLVKHDGCTRPLKHKLNSSTAGGSADSDGVAKPDNCMRHLKNKMLSNNTGKNYNNSDGSGTSASGSGGKTLPSSATAATVLTKTTRTLSTSSGINRRNHLNFVFTSTFHGKGGHQNVHNAHTCIRHSYQIRTTRVLVMVSTFFVVLNLPSHAFRLYAFIQYYKGKTDFTLFALQLQSCMQMLYYCNFSVNMFLYCACSRSFRSAFKRLFNHWKTSICTTSKRSIECMRSCCGQGSGRNKKPARI